MGASDLASLRMSPGTGLGSLTPLSSVVGGSGAGKIARIFA